MSASKVEQVARNMAAAEGWRWGDDRQMIDCAAAGLQHTSRERDTWRARARAAIEAMKDPDVEMLAAFWRQKNNGTQEIGESGDNRSDYDAWRAAMSRALNEEG